MKNAYATADITRWLDEMAAQIRQTIAPNSTRIIGIHTGGVWVAEQLLARLGADFFSAPLGSLNISFYRDDFSRIGLHPQVSPSELPFDVEDQPLLLIDDVLHSGRTIRAALNELFDYGRPASIKLAVLIDRGARELPFKADFIGQQITLPSNQNIKLSQADTAASSHLTLEIIPAPVPDTSSKSQPEGAPADV